MNKLFSLKFLLLALAAVGMLSISSCEKEPDNTINGHEYVDLGLPSGTKWATCNVGATTPEEYGNYYAWGETTVKSEYTEENCTTYGVELTDISGNATYDAARANWGGSWRMPTKAECIELENYCTWTWTTQSGVNGMKVTGPNGNSIFLLAAGIVDELVHSEPCGYYWSSSISTWGESSYAQGLRFSSGATDILNIPSSDGLTIRPVLP